MKKTALGLMAVAMVVTGGSALELKGAITKKARALSIEKAPVKNSTVNVQNSHIHNNTSVSNSAVAGNTGVQIKGKRVNIKNSRITNRTSVKDSAVAGNTGVKIKAERVNVSKSHIKNSSRINKSAVAGNTGVELGN